MWGTSWLTKELLNKDSAPWNLLVWSVYLMCLIWWQVEVFVWICISHRHININDCWVPKSAHSSLFQSSFSWNTVCLAWLIDKCNTVVIQVLKNRKTVWPTLLCCSMCLYFLSGSGGNKQVYLLLQACLYLSSVRVHRTGSFVELFFKYLCSDIWKSAISLSWKISL